MRLKDQISKLEYFCAVAESKSIKEASGKVFIGQPQLTKVIQQLEDTLSTNLIARSAKGVKLTRAGEQLYQYSKKILDQVSEAEFLIKSKDQRFKGEVRIGTYDSIARYFFPDFLKYMKTTMPEINLYLETGRSHYVLKSLKRKSLDIAIVVGDSGSSRTIKSKTIYSDSFGLYVSPGMESSFNNNLIYFLFPMNNTPEAMSRFGFNQSSVCDNLETVRSLTEQAVGVGLMPHRVARQSVVSHKLIPFHHPKIKNNSFDTHQISICFPKSQSSPLQLFVLAEIERFLQMWQ